MCVIITLAPLATINKEQLFNAVYNNWHGFGLVVVDSNWQLDVIKDFDENGTDPNKVWELLEQYKDCYRYLHVRHSTKGATDLSNVQPFEVYHSNDRRVFFMHNGTLTSFGPSYHAADKGKSDTLDFCEKVLMPSLVKWTGERGKGDYSDPDFQRLVVKEQWGHSASTGLFCSNNIPPVRIGNGWSEYKHPDDTSSGEVWTSNTSYYNRVQRGPEFQRLEEIRKAEEAEARAAAGVTVYPFQGSGQSGTGSGSSTDREVIIKPWSGTGVNKDAKILKAIRDIVDRFDLEDPRDVAKLRFIAYDEWIDFIEDEGIWSVAALLENLAEHIGKLNLQLATMTQGKLKAQKRLQEINTGKVEEDGRTSNAA